MLSAANLTDQARVARQSRNVPRANSRDFSCLLRRLATRFSSLPLALLLLLGLAVSTRADRRAYPLVVGLDARAGAGTRANLARGRDFDELRALLVARGLEVRPRAHFRPRDLDGVDVLVLQQPTAMDQRFRRVEIDAIQSLVARGASLLVLGAEGKSSQYDRENLNRLVRPFGVRFLSTQDPTLGRKFQRRFHTVERFERNPLTRGVASLRLASGRIVAALFAPARDLTPGSGADDVLVAARRPGEGLVVALADASVWTDADKESGHGLSVAGNRKLLANLLDYWAQHAATREHLPALGRPLVTPGLDVKLEGLRDAWLGLSRPTSAVLRLFLPAGLSSGRFVDLRASGAQPNALVLVLLGEPTLAGTLSHPLLLDTVAADVDGKLSCSVLVPASAAGHLFGLRLLDPATGETSPVMRFQPHGTEYPPDFRRLLEAYH